MPFSSLKSLVHLGLVGLACSRSILKRDGDIAVGDKWKDHDAIVPFQQSPAADGIWGDVEVLFKPGLNDGRGCFPYAAVDNEGYHGAGLKPTGDIGERCRDSSKGQVYARVGTSNNRTVLLYSWYLSKVQSEDERHKHYYLNVAVWLYRTSCNIEAYDYSIAGVSYSTGPDSWDTASSSSTLYSSGEMTKGGVNTHPIIGYDSKEYVFPSSDDADYALTPPLIDWDALPSAAKEQFNGIVYEHARCPFNDNNFQASIDASYNAAYYADGVPEDVDCTGITPASPSSTVSAATTATSPASDSDGDDSGLVEDGPTLNGSSIPPDPTFTPTPTGTSRRLFV